MNKVTNCIIQCKSYGPFSGYDEKLTTWPKFIQTNFSTHPVEHWISHKECWLRLARCRYNAMTTGYRSTGSQTHSRLILNDVSLLIFCFSPSWPGSYLLAPKARHKSITSWACPTEQRIKCTQQAYFLNIWHVHVFASYKKIYVHK